MAWRRVQLDKMVKREYFVVANQRAHCLVEIGWKTQRCFCSFVALLKIPNPRISVKQIDLTVTQGRRIAQTNTRASYGSFCMVSKAIVCPTLLKYPVAWGRT